MNICRRCQTKFSGNPKTAEFVAGQMHVFCDACTAVELRVKFTPEEQELIQFLQREAKRLAHS